MAVVTISREEGGLGNEAAQRLAKELGYHLVNAQDLHDLARSHDERFACDVKDLELACAKAPQTTPALAEGVVVNDIRIASFRTNWPV